MYVVCWFFTVCFFVGVASPWVHLNVWTVLLSAVMLVLAVGGGWTLWRWDEEILRKKGE
jgi:hypothetical protein